MINKDGGGTIFQFYGGDSCYEGNIELMGVPQSPPPPTRENPAKVENELSKSKLDLKEMETEVGKLKKEKQLQHKFELLNYRQLHISI